LSRRPFLSLEPDWNSHHYSTRWSTGQSPFCERLRTPSSFWPTVGVVPESTGWTNIQPVVQHSSSLGEATPTGFPPLRSARSSPPARPQYRNVRHAASKPVTHRRLRTRSLTCCHECCEGAAIALFLVSFLCVASLRVWLPVVLRPTRSLLALLGATDARARAILLCLLDFLYLRRHCAYLARPREAAVLPCGPRGANGNARWTTVPRPGIPPDLACR